MLPTPLLFHRAALLRQEEATSIQYTQKLKTGGKTPCRLRKSAQHFILLAGFRGKLRFYAETSSAPTGHGTRIPLRQQQQRASVSYLHLAGYISRRLLHPYEGTDPPHHLHAGIKENISGTPKEACSLSCLSLGKAAEIEDNSRYIVV